jgi:hypothetical protein
MTKIIAFAGRKQSGKTTCSNCVIDFWYNVVDKEKKTNAKIYNFADLLKKNVCMDIFGMTYDQCYGSDDDKNTITHLQWEDKLLSAREVMQFVGTDIFRKMDKNVWANATINQIEKESPELAVIADCRFPNEVEAVKKAGGIVIKLTRNPFNSDHTSEVALDSSVYSSTNFDIVITNHLMDIDQQNYAVVKFLNKKGIFTL